MKHFAIVLLSVAAFAAPICAQGTTYADVVIAVDTSGSMAGEVAMVTAELNDFASTLSTMGVDLHLVLIASPSNVTNGICALAPLGSGNCPADSNLPIYRHVATTINSNDAFQKILSTYSSWSASLRPAASTTVIVITDDDSNSAWTGFDIQFRNLNPNFQHYRMHALVATNACVAGAVIGQQYINLATYTGGLVRDLCNQDFGPDFDAMAAAVAGPMSTFCTAGTSTHACVPSITGSGTASASAPSGFTITVSNVEGAKAGLIFYGVNNTGWTPLPWAGGSSSYLCIASPIQRTTAQTSGGTAGQCNGALSIDWNAFAAAHPGALGAPFSSGDTIFAQGWFRDPPAPKTTNLSNALRFTLSP